jgi:two-component system, OmpR family, response regulator ChvI
LEDEGFIVDVFNDPILALSNYRTNWYDLLLLDVRMPKMSGFELYQKIKDVDNKANVCFITAFNQYQEFKDKFPGSDVDCFIKKPIEIQKLVKIVKSKV